MLFRSRPGQLIVCDTISPLLRSLGGGKYWMFLNDIKSKFRLSYVVSSKDKIAECVIKGLKKLKTLSGNMARKIQMDGDGSYVSLELKDMITDLGVQASWSSPYDHPQNGAAEENVHTQWGDCCAAMYLSGAPNDLWPEAVSCRFQ